MDSDFKSFKNKNVPEIKQFLKNRGVKTTGYKKKNKLVELAEEADLQKIPPFEPDNYIFANKIRRTVDGVVLPHPRTVIDWSEDLNAIPIIEAFDVNHYLKNICNSTNERLKGYKNDNSYRLHSNGHIVDRIIFENTEEVDDSADQKKQIEKLKAELVNQKQDAEQEIKKIQNNFDTRLLIATQEKATIQHELKHQIKDLQDALEGEMEEKNEYAKLIEEIKQKYAMESLALQEFNQQEKEKLLIKVDQDKLEKLEKQKEQMDLLEIERREMKDVMESIEKKFESEKAVFMEKTNQLITKLNEERATQALTIEREKLARKKCDRLEEEIKHLQMYKRVTETIVQHEKNPKSNTQATETSKVTDTSNTVQIPEQNKQPNSSGPSPQRLPCYDGKTEWKPYYMQFIHFSNRYRWDSKQRLDRLIECLRDKALKFYSTRPPSVQNDLVQLSEKMNQRFGNKDLPYTIRRQLQEVRQNIDETVEEFAERVQEMATDGYGPNTPENVVETISVDAFLKGCNDKKATLLAMEKNPITLDTALQCVKKLAVRALNRYDRRSSTSYDRRQTPFSDWQSSVESRLKKTEQDIGDIKDDVSKILMAVSRQSISSPNRRSISPGRSPDRSNDECFRCHEKGHYARNCPNTTAVARVLRSSSPKPIERDQHLNSQGLKK
ncbi:unnamed protein product [Mytilus coruscus]|uniref:CCHC-type domain-containing protein n=1 Tax=Mytilus coruscus TaxID=42192 RepID=A0A6J8BH85_MYTCO|nr:unnamed protein product [Mytilus coruscus]